MRLRQSVRRSSDYWEIGGAGGPAGATGGSGGVEAVTVGGGGCDAGSAGVADGSGLFVTAAAVDAGAGVTGGTGSGRVAGGSAFAAEWATKDEAQAMVKKAVVFIKEKALLTTSGAERRATEEPDILDS